MVLAGRLESLEKLVGDMIEEKVVKEEASMVGAFLAATEGATVAREVRVAEVAALVCSFRLFRLTLCPLPAV